MAVLADSKLRQLEYFESHAPIWMVHAGGVGLSGAAAAELTARTREARAAYDALVAIRAAALSATQVWYNM